MRVHLLIISFIVVFAGCSQESSEKKEQGIQVEQKVPRSSNKNEALICLDEDEKITCKLMTKRVKKERSVRFKWESPHGKDNRERTMVLPVNHASIFDARDKKGRAKGKWKVVVELDGDKVSTSFQL